MTKFRLKLNINTFKGNVQRELHKRMLKVAYFLEGIVKKMIEKSNHGGTRPSRPGEPPRSGTGLLRDSISNQVSKDGSGVTAIYGVIKSVASSYAKRLELGFTGRDRKGRNYNQQPRPFLRPSYRKNKRKILQIVRQG